MKLIKRTATALGFAAITVTGYAQAISLQDSLSSAASQLSQGQTQSTTTASTSNGLNGLNGLTGLLNSSDQTLNAGSMDNAAGVLQYCMKQKLVSATNTENVKNQLLNKLGLTTQQETQQQTDYTQGLAGILNTSNGNQFNLDSLKNTPLAKKARTKACNIVLKQGSKFISQ